jgi:putative hydrolase of the HAD superfamily
VNPVCVVFDLDDTLYLERDYVRSGFRSLEAWAKINLGLDDFCLRAWTLFNAGARGNIFDRILIKAGIEPDRNTIQTMVDLYRGHIPDIQLAADAADCLQDVRDQVHLALVSDGPEQSQRNKIKALGLERSFEAVILTAALGSGYAKPHLKAFLDVQKYFGPAVQQYTYVADNPIKDFIAPRNLGWKTIRVRRDQGLYSCLEADKFASADAEVPNLDPLAISVRGRQQRQRLC